MTEAIRLERQSLSHEWISAQTRSNFQAGIGVACMLSPIVLIVSVVLDFDYMTIALGILVCLSAGMFSFGRLQYNRFSLDEWVENGERQRIEKRIAELEHYESIYTEMVEANRLLQKQVEMYRFQLNARPHKTKEDAQSVPISESVQTKPLPQAVIDGYSIIQRWFLDVDQVNHPNVSKHSLVEAGMNTDRQRNAWQLLTTLDIAGRAGTGDNAKRIILPDNPEKPEMGTDQNEINHKMELYINNLMRDGNGYVQN